MDQRDSCQGRLPCSGNFWASTGTSAIGYCIAGARSIGSNMSANIYGPIASNLN